MSDIKTYTYQVDLESLTIVCNDIFHKLDSCKVIFLSGDLGAGKTTFVKKIAKCYGVIDEVSSPTFSLVNEYLCDSGSKIYHMDLYRIQDDSELLDIGFLEYVDSGNICFIEWPEIASNLIDPDAIININSIVSGRRLKIEIY